MSKSTISVYQLMQSIPDNETARVYLEMRLWPNGPVCPECKNGERITKRKRIGFYRCNACAHDFTIRTGTIFERSKVDLNKWVYAMYLLVTARKGISSLQLAKEIGVTQKTAWFILHRLREACAGKLEKLRGVIEIDEVFIGGKEKNRHEVKRQHLRGTVGKTPVLGMRSRDGRVKAMPIKAVSAVAVNEAIQENIEAGSTLNTDEGRAYTSLDKDFKHEAVNHKAGEYVRGEVYTNGIESVWAVLKRGLHGVYHHASPKHLARYVDEFTFRLNEGNVKVHTLERLDSFIDAIVGKRLTYERLTA
jgi:transposase-like protein